MTQQCYLEELVDAIFLGGLETLIFYQIRGSILSKTHLVTLAMTFSSMIRVLFETPLVPSPTPNPVASSNYTTSLSFNSKGKGHHTNGGRMCGQGHGRGHNGQPFPLCEHC